MFEINKNIVSSNTIKISEDNLVTQKQNLLNDTVFNSVSDGIILTNIEGKIITGNNSALRLFLFDSLEDITGLNIINLISPEEREKAELNTQRILNEGSIEKEKFICLRTDEETFVSEISSSLLNDDRNVPIGFLSVISDISEIESANEQLRLLVTALESAANEVVITDNKGEVIWVNSSFNKLTGYSDNEVLGNTPSILKSGIHNNDFYKNLWETISGGNIWSGEITNKKKNGEIYTEEMTITPLESSDGQITNYIAIKQDITEKKKAEKEIQESELKYRSIFENSTIGIYRADRNGDIIVANSRFLQILGLNSVDDIKNVNPDQEYYQSDSNRKKFIDILKKEQKIYGFETKWKRADGTLIYIRESATAFVNSSGKLDYYEGTVEDITDNILSKKEIQKQANILSALRYSSELFLTGTDWKKNLNKVIEKIGTAFNISNLHVCRKETNQNDEIIFNHVSSWKDQSVIINKEYPEKLVLNDHGLLRWNKVLSENNIINDVVNKLPTDEKIFLAAFGVRSIIIVPILLDGIFWGAIAFHQYDYDRIWNDSEIEALKAASETFSAAIKRHNYENDLLEAKQEAENADRTKSEFLAQISHEIRTPLNNITSFNTLIKDQIQDQIDDDIQECFDVIDKASNRLIRTIGLILNLSELHTGSFKVHSTNFDIHSEILEKLYLENRFIAKQNNVEFKLINNAKSTIIQADKYSLEQIFDNLVDNALKYTSKGKIEITIENDYENRIIIKVFDTGIGISKDYLPNIFNSFSQEDGGYKRKYDGNGIGLSLVKEYCELNNIEIKVDSKKDWGTTFTLKLKSQAIS